MYVITGGAGFIGSNVAAALDAEEAEIALVDWVGCDDFKWRNIAKRRLANIVAPENLKTYLDENRGKISAIVHMGAISTTTETDVDKIIRNNFNLSMDLWRYCAQERIPFVYASSAATYGDGSQGFYDRFDDAYLSALRPLNPYGWSKHLFDRWVLRVSQNENLSPPRWAGLKFFNVYGPNEYHKGGQCSVAAQLFEQIRSQGFVRLFKSDRSDYADGGQMRDFVWVGDCADVVLWFLKSAYALSGLYNVGSGQARSFADKAKIVFSEMGLEPRIEFIDLPPNLRGKYQYYTQAEMTKIRNLGYRTPLTSLEHGLRRYVQSYLSANDHFC